MISGPHQPIYHHLGEAQIEQIITQNVEENVTDQAMQIVNALWDNRDQLQAAVEGNDHPDADLPDEEI